MLWGELKEAAASRSVFVAQVERPAGIMKMPQFAIDSAAQRLLEQLEAVVGSEPAVAVAGPALVVVIAAEAAVVDCWRRFQLPFEADIAELVVHGLRLSGQGECHFGLHRFSVVFVPLLSAVFVE